jgi:hypothetical protein
VVDFRAVSRRALVAAGLLAVPSGAAARRKKRPKLKLAGGCDAVANSSTGPSDVRFAVTFVATRTGRLREVRIGVEKEEGSAGDRVVQLVSVNGTSPSELPANVLAAAPVDDREVPVGLSTLVATLGAPLLVGGTRYAVAVGRRGGADVGVRTSGTPCPESQVFIAVGDGPFSSFAPVGVPLAVFVA